MMELAVVKRIDEDPIFGSPLLKPARLKIFPIEPYEAIYNILLIFISTVEGRTSLSGRISTRLFPWSLYVCAKFSSLLFAPNSHHCLNRTSSGCFNGPGIEQQLPALLPFNHASCLCSLLPCRSSLHFLSLPFAECPLASLADPSTLLLQHQ